MHRSDPVIINVAALDAAAVKAGLTMEVNGATVVSQTKIAARLGVVQSTVSRARAGRPVSGRLVGNIIRAFGLSYGEVVREPDEAAA